MSENRKIVYCHCAYAKVIPDTCKDGVLEALGKMDKEVSMVPDLCQSAAAKDPEMRTWLSEGPVSVIACYKRSIKWLAHQAEVPWNEEEVRVHNMRESTAEEILKALEEDHVQ